MIPASHDGLAVRGRLGRVALQLSRDKSDTLLLIFATVLVLAPHAAHLPLWVTLLSATTLAWRALITFRGLRMPPSYLLLPLALAAMGGIYLTFRTILGRDAGVAMAVLLIAFKMLEMHARRDLFVVIFLNYFLLLANFFYSQSIGTAVLMLGAVLALLTAQLSFQYTGAVPPLRRRALLALKIVAIAGPVALVLFLVFPRIQGPLWGMPSDANAGKSGLSNRMSPGNIASLALSEDTAFRVRFEGAPPSQEKLYWRALVLDEFDGRSWLQSGLRWRNPGDPALQVRGAEFRYEITLEPHNEHWLFALEMASGARTIARAGADLTDQHELRFADRIGQRMRYSLTSHAAYQLEGGAAMRGGGERYRALPTGFNPQAMQAGLDLQREADPARRVQIVLERFRKESYSYTLDPPTLGVHSVDEFLYQSRAGFCEHYASAFVFLMRAADVPARVVTGYQGGEMNPVDGYMTIKQSDAHAWAEVWLGERGWVRVDPTGAVAPERIQRSSGRARSGEQFGGLLSMQLDQNSLLERLRFQMSALTNGWNQWVLNYDAQRRRDVMTAIAEAFANGRTLGALALVCCLIVVARALHLRREIDRIDALYSALCRQMGRHGVMRAPDEGPNAFAERLAAHGALAPSSKEAALRFLALYSAHKYGAEASDAALLSTLKRLLNKSQ